MRLYVYEVICSFSIHFWLGRFLFFRDGLLLAKNTRRDGRWNIGFWLAGCTKVYPYRNIIPDGIGWWVWCLKKLPRIMIRAVVVAFPSVLFSSI